MEDFCYKCAKANMEFDSERDPCPILGRMMGYGVKDKEYPAELTYDEANDPICTAFKPKGTPEELPRCQLTVDMFEGDNGTV